ncbi:hypothetical protein PPTG_15188 [Plasmopara halstedii]|uniref:FAD-binding FR-type domain-containing protein n=1 Tax=Plasmopara halstedii TaxID=4781 RepID=A0A0P1AFE6_PLAHL|nr:hypothetical protein PPTG_15188 [Plasmopara halstedii]CEG39818.1 hypothetical protein PPTG_15188 [Plasmopara halstedii]|eukprot:XP_024576187.1 hypothetical protein PPTG_15188 [Plasmopara halstedii]
MRSTMASDANTTPQIDAELATLKTPDIDEKRSTIVNASQYLLSDRFSTIRIVLQGFILLAMLIYAYSQLFYFSKTYSDVSTTIGMWYHVPIDAKKDSKIGHKEMVRPTFFVLVCFVPLAVSLVIFELLKRFNMHRVTLSTFLKTCRVLRRKPRLFGHVTRLSLGEFLFLAFLIGGNMYVFYFYYLKRVNKSHKKGLDFNFQLYLEMVSITFGFNCVFNLAFLFLPATRNCVWMEFLNISYANGIKYHRWIGVATILTALFHCIGYYWSWLRIGEWKANVFPCFNCDISDEGHDKWRNFFGEMALLSFLAIGITSIPWMRRNCYNTFYSVHHLFVVGLVFAVLHWNPVLAWLLPSLILYTICRCISNCNGFTPVAVSDFTTHSHGVIKMVLYRSANPTSDFHVGQFVYLKVPSISQLQWHAFSIASAPRSSPDTLTILSKAVGDWTQELVKYFESCKSRNILPTIYMDGFYGASLDIYDEYSTICLVGGGIGVTPLLAILEDTVAKLRRGEKLNQKLTFIFSFRELSLLEEIYPILQQIKELDPSQRYLCQHLYLTRTPTATELDKSINRQRTSEKRLVDATQYYSSKVPRPFRSPLYSCASKVAVFSASFLTTLLVVLVVKYGNKVEAIDKTLWPLQSFIEISLLFAVTMIVVYTGVALTKHMNDPETTTSQTFDTVHMPYPSSIAPDVHTFRDLIREFSVEIGHRANIAELMNSAFVQHVEFRKTQTNLLTVGNATVGVFVSGPKELKRSVEYAVADIGIRYFDVHKEEFEL